MKDNKKTKIIILLLSITIVALIITIFFIALYPDNADDKKESRNPQTQDTEADLDTDSDVIPDDFGTDIFPEPYEEFDSAAFNEAIGSYTYACTGVVTDADSMLEQVKLICTLHMQPDRVNELAVSETFIDYVLDGYCALNMGKVYKYGVNDYDFFVITSDYLICGFFDQNNQICAMWPTKLRK